LKIYSNRFIFGEDGKLEDIHTIVTSMSKSTMLNKENMKFRKNNLLFGDLPTDVLMEKSMGVETSLRIGFLDNKKIHLLDSYEKVFDVLLIGEGTFDFALYIYNKIFNFDNT